MAVAGNLLLIRKKERQEKKHKLFNSIKYPSKGAKALNFKKNE